MAPPVAFDAVNRTRLLVELAATPEPRRLVIFVEGPSRELAWPELAMRVISGRLVEARASNVTGARALARLALADKGTIEVLPDRTPPSQPVAKYPDLMRLLHEADAQARAMEAPLSAVGGLESVLVADLDQLMSQLAELPDAASAVLRLVDGARTVGAVLRDSPYEELLAARILERLVASDILHLAAPVPAPSAMPESTGPMPRRMPPPLPQPDPTARTLPGLPTADELEGAGVDADIHHWLEHEHAPEALLTDDGFLRAFTAKEAAPPPPPPTPPPPDPPPSAKAPPPPPEPPPNLEEEEDTDWIEDSSIGRTPPNRTVLFIALGVLALILILMISFGTRTGDRASVAKDAGVRVEPVVIPPVVTPTIAKTKTPTKAEIIETLVVHKTGELPPIAGPEAPEDVKEAERLLNAQSYPEAAKLLSQLRATRPNDPAVWVLSGQLHVDSKGRLDLALEAADHALSISPKFYRAWVLRGSVMQFLGKRKPAAEAYERALSLEPEHPMSAELRGILERLR